jgi:thiol-disulfide isomerase/thioredoxin
MLMKSKIALLVVCAVLLAGCSSRQKLDMPLQPLDASAKRLTLDQMKGKVVLIDFWATYCGPCHMAMPSFEHLYRQYKDRGLIVLGITAEDRETVVKFLASNPTPIDYPILLDNLGSVNREFNVTNIPYAVLLGKNGDVLDTVTGYPMDVAKLSREIEDAL